ncbi:hypothetical protein GCM10023115_23870 [Pontixanthobacter gangjinensis]
MAGGSEADNSAATKAAFDTLAFAEAICAGGVCTARAGLGFESPATGTGVTGAADIPLRLGIA